MQNQNLLAISTDGIFFSLPPLNVIKQFSPSASIYRNKLECLSQENILLSSLVFLEKAHNQSNIGYTVRVDCDLTSKY